MNNSNTSSQIINGLDSNSFHQPSFSIKKYTTAAAPEESLNRNNSHRQFDEPSFNLIDFYEDTDHLNTNKMNNLNHDEIQAIRSIYRPSYPIEKMKDNKSIEFYKYLEGKLIIFLVNFNIRKIFLLLKN